MEKIFDFSKKFLEKEVEVFICKCVFEFDVYNNVFQEYYLFLVDEFYGIIGYMFLDELCSEVQYVMLKGYLDDVFRRIFKISEYESFKYGKVWVVFVFGVNFIGICNCMDNVFIVIDEVGKLKIVKFLFYINYIENKDLDVFYRWDDMRGYVDLNFEIFGRLEMINCYLELVSWEFGLE